MHKLSNNELKKISGGKAVKCSTGQVLTHAAGGFLIGAISLNPVSAAVGGVVGGLMCSPR